eukprot:GDKI01002080.1.p1 GENE.GDKI01002080.1~~GDKI01002080.1.p1  ORF type:complete len:299 (+),score=87.08 GDKI01002080.1:3-899(+)
MQCWGSVTANTVKGSDGTRFQPDTPRGKRQDVFVSDLVRSLPFEHSGDHKLKGINTHTYTIARDAMLSADLNPANADYFAYGPSGALNMTNCAGVPIFVSKPHFLDADEWYTEQVTGLSPDRQLHDTVLYVEPITGNTVGAKKHLMISFKVETDNWPEKMGGKLKSAVVPLATQSQEQYIPDSDAKLLTDALYTPVDTAEMVASYAFPVGCCLIAAGVLGLCVAMFFLCKKKTAASRPLLTSQSSSNGIGVTPNGNAIADRNCSNGGLTRAQTAESETGRVAVVDKGWPLAGRRVAPV